MSLLYNVSTLLKESVGSTREYDIDEAAFIDGDQPHSERVSGHAVFLRTNAGVLVTAALHGEHHELCGRCLRDVSVPMDLNLEDEYFATANLRTGAPLQRPEDPEAFLIDDRQQLDLEEAVRQAWTSALPLRALCRVDCRGLCPTCGKDLNEGPCGCAPQPDDRWSALRALTGEREGK